MLLRMIAPSVSAWSLPTMSMSSSMSMGSMSSSRSSSAVGRPAASDISPRQLVVFRPRSRHTYGFDSDIATGFDLPHLELASLIGESHDPSHGSSIIDITCDDADQAQLAWVEGVASSALRDAAQRAVLLHGAFSVVSSAATIELAAQRLHELGWTLPEDAETIDIVDLAQPNLRKNARVELHAELQQHCARQQADVSSSSSSGSSSSRSRSRTGRHEEVRSWVMLRERSGCVHLGWRLAVGPAASLRAPGLASGRRCYSGWLGRFALKNREHAALTAMEPEIAFLMANWARITVDSRVLDPCVGSGSLLVSAAALGATSLVGVDQNASAFVGARKDFARLSLPVPTFVQGDVLAPGDTAELARHSFYDAIVSDPPYNLRAPVYVEGEVSSAQDPRPAADLTGALIELAATALVPKGRLVLFVPARGAEIDLALPELLERRIPDPRERQRLKIVHARLQRFTTRRSRRAGSSARPRSSRGPGAFARWLVCLEKTTDVEVRNDGEDAQGETSGDKRMDGPGLLEAIQACGTSEWRRAIELTQGSEWVDAFAASAAMARCAKAGEWRAAIQLLDRVAEPDRACFHSALAACERGASAAAATTAAMLLDRMDSAGLPPTPHCFTATATAALNAGDWRGALAVFDRMRHGQSTREGHTPPLQFSDFKVAISAAVVGEDWPLVITLAQTALREVQRPLRADRKEWLWRTWSDAQMTRVGATLDAAGSLSVDASATDSLQRALSAAATNGKMPSFADPGARGGYTLAHMGTRTRKVADVLRLSEPAWLAPAVDEGLRAGRVIASLGGGPGFDHLAVALLSEWRRIGGSECSGGSDDGSGPVASTMVLDYESGWQEECHALSGAVAAVLGAAAPTCSFDGADITRAIDASANHALAQALPRTRLLIASYVVAENAHALEASRFEFFETLFRDAAVGTTLLVLETTHRSFPGVVKAAQRGVMASGHDHGLDIACPWVTRNAGYSLLLRKRDGCSDEEDECSIASLLEDFEMDAVRHSRRVSRSERRRATDAPPST